jgi:hypothetical protein
MQNWRSRCWEIWEARDIDEDPLNGWAGRLCEELSAILYDYEREEVDA